MAKSPSSARQDWMRGYGVIQHTPLTCARIDTLASGLVAANQAPDEDTVYAAFIAADRLTSAAMWVVAHMTYANRVDLGRPRRRGFQGDA